jgi:tRNA1(Val) A37 N6-methylase TrmN6
MSIFTIPDILHFKQDFTVSLADKDNYGAIYTPFSLIQQMLDLFPPAVFTDPTKTWLDLGAGHGYFAMLVFDRLNKGLAAQMPEEHARKQHIVEKMLYLLEVQESNVAILRAMFGAKANIYSMDFLTTTTLPAITYDCIIGNPPYNAHGLKKVPTNTSRAKKADGTTVWATFIERALPLLQPTTGQLCFIVPVLWLKPDKNQLHQRLFTRTTLEKIHCLSSNETNTLFKGEAQTPTCFFLLTNTPPAPAPAPGPEPGQILHLYDTQRQAYVPYRHRVGTPVPLFGAHLIQKVQPWLAKAGGALRVHKTNMPPKKSQFTQTLFQPAYPYTNITTCVLEGLQPVLLLNYSDQPQAFHGQPKLVLAHKMYGFPYWDKDGHYGIANRDNYVILQKTPTEFAQLAAFLSTKFVLYLYEAARYRMKYLEKYAFEFIPDVTRLAGFPLAADISDETVADFFGLDATDRVHIQRLHKKEYKRFL